jgi:hypothetical protein
MGVIIGEETAYPSSSASVISGVRFERYLGFCGVFCRYMIVLLLIQLPLSEGYIVYIIINNTSGLSISITNISN